MVRFTGTVTAWLFSAFSSYLVVSTVAAPADGLLGYGAAFLRSIWPDDLLALFLVLAFIPALYLGSLVKALIPLLSPLVYPLAGIGAVAGLSAAAGQVSPYLDPSYLAGWTPALLAGAVGGLLFELLRPRGRD